MIFQIMIIVPPEMLENRFQASTQAVINIISIINGPRFVCIKTPFLKS